MFASGHFVCELSQAFMTSMAIQAYVTINLALFMCVAENRMCPGTGKRIDLAEVQGGLRDIHKHLR